jgi:hypothetical protein
MQKKEQEMSALKAQLNHLDHMRKTLRAKSRDLIQRKQKTVAKKDKQRQRNQRLIHGQMGMR